MIFWPIMLVQRVLHLSPLSQDGSGRGAALVAAVLKGKEWRGDPRRLNSSSSPNCLVDHLNQLWPDPKYPRSFHAPLTVSTKSAKYRSQNFKIKFPQSVLCYIYQLGVKGSWNSVTKSDVSGPHVKPTWSSYSLRVHLPGLHKSRCERTGRHLRSNFLRHLFLAQEDLRLNLLAFTPGACHLLVSSASYILC